MTIHQEYNPGPVIEFLGHGMTCSIKPPLIVSLEGADFIKVVSKHEVKSGDVLYAEDHKRIIEFLVGYAEACASNGDGTEIVAKYLNLMPTAVKYVQYISSRFLPEKNDKDILEDGHKIVINDVPYDIRHLDHRVRLIENAKSLHLTKDHIQKINDFQKKHMSIFIEETNLDQGTIAWEMRERIVSRPCGLLWNNKKLDIAALPPSDSYITLNYKLELAEYSTSKKNLIDISVYLNKAALKHDQSVADSAYLRKYDEFEGVCKSGTLSGKHFIFIHLKCIKEQCDDHKKPCSTSVFMLSKIHERFISKLHVLIKNTTEELSYKNIKLKTSEDLGSQSPVGEAEDFAYYDLAMQRESTIVVVSCTGMDTVCQGTFVE